MKPRGCSRSHWHKIRRERLERIAERLARSVIERVAELIVRARSDALRETLELLRELP